MSGSVAFKFENGVFFADISGYAEIGVMENVLAKFFEKLEEDFCFFVFNFADMTLINSTALGVMVEIISESMGNDSVKFYFCAIPPACRLGMAGVGILKYVKECSNVQEALELIGS